MENKKDDYLKRNDKYYKAIKKGLCKEMGKHVEDVSTIGCSLDDYLDFSITSLLTTPGDLEVWVGGTYIHSEKKLYIHISIMEKIIFFNDKLKDIIKEYEDKFPSSILKPEILENDCYKEIRFLKCFDNVLVKELASISENAINDFLDKEKSE